MSIEVNTPSEKASMWYEALPQEKSWAALWSGYTICGHCHGIRRFDDKCQVCGDPEPSFEPLTIRDAGGQERIVHTAIPGAEGRFEDWVYLRMIEREWKRPVLADDRFPGAPSDAGPSPRAAIVILFWSYFETRIERLLRAGLRDTPERLLKDALRRYSSIGARMNEFYRIAFDVTYKDDLETVGYGQVWPHLAAIQERRNQFAHGQPQSIDDALVQSTVEQMKVEHEAWIAVFNKRAARP